MLPLPRGAVWQIFFLLCAVLLANEVRSEGRIVCYYTNWSVYRPGSAKYNPQNINPYLCTHLVYAFGGFTKDNTMKPFDKYQDIEQGGYAKFTGLKTYNKQLKTMIAIGGWNEASSRFSPLVASSERRHQFVKNILKFLRQNHFDGIDLDWEYPAHRDGGKSRDKDNYAQFVQELRAEFDRESAKTGRPRLLLTMAVPAGIQYIEKGYDIPKLNKYLDWFNLLSYDFHSSHEPAVNHHAPLYSLEEDDEYNFDSELNIDYSIKYYLDAGADRDKLVLGIPTYGRSYTLFNEESTDLGAPADGPGEQGDATREKGYLAYYEICQNVKEDPDWNVIQPNPKAMGPYAFKGNQWVGYDDEAIVRKKAEYVVEHGLGGIMFWSIDNDDFRGTCTGKPYPLIEAAKETYLDRLGLGDNEVGQPQSKKKPLRSRSRIGSSNRNKVEEVVEKAVAISRKRPSTRKRPQAERSTTTTTTSSSLYIGGRTTTPVPPTTPDPGSDFKCEEEGFFQHPRDCKKYFWCLDSGPSQLGIVAHQFTCPSGLYFNPAADSCDFARNVLCNKKDTTSTTSKPQTTTTTTTPRTTTSSSRITAATSRSSFTRFTSTTRAPEDDEEEYEEDEADGTEVDSEEDPRVIKELIDLIKKVGGIEELEKHILHQEDGTVMLKKDDLSSVGITTTPPSISKSLYDKVLSRPNNLSAFRNRFTSSTLFRSTSKPQQSEDNDEDEEVQNRNTESKYSSVVRNSRPGPQNAGIEKLAEFDGFLKEKKKYVTIQRTRPAVSLDNDDLDDDDESLSLQKDAAAADDDEEEIRINSSRRPTSSSTPAYTSIRRTKSPTVRPAALDDDDKDEDIILEKKTYTPLNRNRVRSTTDVTPASEVEITTVSGNRYKYLERTRPTRRPTATTSPKEDIDEESEESVGPPSVTVQFSEPNEISTQSPTLQPQTTIRAYASIGRRTTTSTTDQAPTTTTTPSDNILTDTTTSTTPEPIFITTTTNPTSIETSTQSSTTSTTPILTQSLSYTSTISTSTSSDDTEATTLAPKISQTSSATESGLDTQQQELDVTLNQLSSDTITTTTTTDETNNNEVTNTTTTLTTPFTRNKTKSSLNKYNLSNSNRSSSTSSSSSSNSIRGTVNYKYNGGGRRQQQKQRTTTRITTATNDSNQSQSETSTSTNEFLGTVSSPRPFGFPRRRARPTTTTTPATSTISSIITNALDDTSNASPSSSQSIGTTSALLKKRIQYNRTAGRRRPTTTTQSTDTESTISTQVNTSTSPSPDANDIVDSSSTSITSVNGTSQDTEAEAEVTSPKPRRRFKVLKFRHPLNRSNNSLSVQLSNSTNTTTGSVVSVDNLGVGLASESTSADSTTRASTWTPPTRRFRKVIKKLRPLPVANGTIVEETTVAAVNETRRPLSVAELLNRISKTTTTTTIAPETTTDEQEETTMFPEETTTFEMEEDKVSSSEAPPVEQTSEVSTPDLELSGNSTTTDLEILGNNTTTEQITESTTAATPPRRVLVSRRPYRPTKPSLNAITSTAATSVATPRTYVRKFNRNFKAIRPPTDSANGIGFIQRPSIRPPTAFRNRFNFPTRSGTITRVQQPQDEDENQTEEDYDEEENVDEEEEHIQSPIVRPNLQFNRNHAQGNSQENEDEENEEEDENEDVGSDEEEDEEEGDEEDHRNEDNEDTDVSQPPSHGFRPSNRPSFNRPKNVPFNPNRPAGPAPSNRFSNDRRPTNKPRVINRPQPITLPPSLLLESDKPSLPDIVTPPSVFISTNTRSYERKYSATSTEGTPVDQSNPLLEDLNIDALNARNKKIFEVNSKKHTTIKPKRIQNQPQQPTSDTTDTPTTTSPDTSTTFDNTDDDNNLINSQEATTMIPTEEGITEEAITEQPPQPDERQLILYSPEKKLVTINRVVEINSKEEKLRRKSNEDMLKTIEFTELRSEGLPKLEQLGEISRVKYVHLVDGSHILVDSHSTVTDYTPTEASTFVRNTIPEVEPDSLENTQVNYEAGSTSAPVRNSVPDVEYSVSSSADRKSKAATVPEVIADVVEASTISLQGLFDSARQAKKISEAANEVNGIFYAYSLGEIPTTPRNEKPTVVVTSPSPVFLTTTPPPPPESTTTTTTEAPTTLSETTTTSSTTSTTTTTTPEPATTLQEAATTTNESTTILPSPAPLTTTNRTYTRPIVPLLRPESNESPLVISIANLDKVILSKVVKSDSNSASSTLQESVVEAPRQDLSHTEVLQTSESGGLSSNTLGGSSANAIETKVLTETSYSSETHVVKRKKTSKRKNKSRHHRKQLTTLRSVDDEVATTISPVE